MAFATFFLYYFFWDKDVMLGGVTAILTEGKIERLPETLAFKSEFLKAARTHSPRTG